MLIETIPSRLIEVKVWFTLGHSDIALAPSFPISLPNIWVIKLNNKDQYIRINDRIIDSLFQSLSISMALDDWKNNDGM